MTTRATKQPLYDQLVDILTDKIEHEYEPGDMLPSERALSERYGLSRTTVRLALQELERQGYVIRKHGRGTFVADRSTRVADLLESYSFSEQMRDMGREPSTFVLEFDQIEADKNLARAMNITLGDKLYKLRRLRLADDLPMMVEVSYLPVRLFLSLTRPMLEEASLYDIIENTYSQKIHVAEEDFCASVAKASDARLLDIAEGDPVLNLVRTTFNTENEVVEYTLSVARGDQFKYRVYHYRSE